MAKLKIFYNNDTTSLVPDEVGYKNVAEGLIADLTNFDSASDKDRSDLLQKYANSDKKTHTIYQLTRGTGGGGSDVNEPIDKNNCKIDIEYDGRKKPATTYGKHKLALPELLLGDTLTTGYLEEYVKKVVSLYGATGGGTTAQQTDDACKFLFGIMLLTRCR
jgi:hypothetical protein